MPDNRSFEAALKIMHKKYRAKVRRRFLGDLREQIEEDDRIREIFLQKMERLRYVAVTSDRRKNDNRFSYSYFDMTLYFLDSICGGNGIYKPTNQIRALQWNGKKSELVRALRFFGSNNPEIDFRRLLVLPFPVPPKGFRIDKAIYMK